MKNRAILHEKVPRVFDELDALCPLGPIRGERELDRAESIAGQLALLDRRTRDQEDYLQTLSLLIEAYEDRHHAIATSDLDPIELLRSLMESHEMSASDLGRLLGNRSLGAAVLRGDRDLSKAHILVLCEHFGVGPELFLKPKPGLRRAS